MMTIIILIVSVTLHEFGHAAMANVLGDSTSKKQGRLSLNPLVHADLYGSFIVPLVLWVLNVNFLLGWAKPVPVDPRYFKSPKWGLIAVAAAGPLMNLALIGCCQVLLGVTSDFLYPLLMSGIVINGTLLVFNLMPIPPLDGYQILSGLLPNHLLATLRRWETVLSVIFFILFFFYGFDYVLYPLISLLLNGVMG